MYSENATKFCEIFPLLLTTVHTVKSRGRFCGLLRIYELYTSTKYISYHYHQTLIHTYIMLCLAQAKFFSCHFLGCEPLFINIVALLYEKVFEI